MDTDARLIVGGAIETAATTHPAPSQNEAPLRSILPARQYKNEHIQIVSLQIHKISPAPQKLGSIV